MTAGVTTTLCAWLYSLFVFLLLFPQPAAWADLAQSREITKAAMADTSSWPLPPEGPSAAKNKMIVFIAEDLRHGGTLGVGTGVCEAAAAIGWQCQVVDIGSLDARREAIFAKVFALKPDGIVLGGIESRSNLRYLERFKSADIPIVGWHVAPFPGEVAGTPIVVNVTTDSREVAKVAAHYVIADSDGKASVILFNDSRFAIAQKKTDIMAQIIGECEGCNVLEILDVSLDSVGVQMPEIISALLSRYDEQWNYSLGINDLYYDNSVTSLVLAGKEPAGMPYNVSAGDGSASAFMRIRSNSYQKATVPEPLLFHGWQLVDELNRIFRKQPPSGYVTPPHIVTRDNIWEQDGGLSLFDIQNNYRDHYTRSWTGAR